MTNSICAKIVCWFDRGHFYILEQIFLRLPTKSIQTCKQVSEEWRKIVELFCNSEVQRIIKWQDKRIDQARNSRDFSLKLLIDLKAFSARDMIADGSHVILVGLNQELEPEIKIFDSQSFQPVKFIKINETLAKTSPGYQIKYGHFLGSPIKASINEKFLTVNFVETFEQEQSTICTTFVWIRENSFSERPFIMAKARRMELLPNESITAPPIPWK